MTVPEDVGRDLTPGELLPAHNLLGPGLFRQAVYGPEHSLGAQVPAGRRTRAGLRAWGRARSRAGTGVRARVNIAN